MRGDAHVIGRETRVELQRSALRHGFRDAVAEALEGHRAVGERFLFLKLRFDVIER